MKKKKIMSVLFCLMFVFSMIAGCSQSDRSSSENRKNEKITLSLLIDNQTSQDGILAAAEYIEKKYNIAIEVETRPGGAEGDNLVKTRLATGDIADLVFYNSGSLLQALNPEQNFVDLTNEPFMKNVMDSFKEVVTVNGKVFGAPATPTQVGGWLYNKKVYKELGLSVPKTWDELMENNEKIKAAGKTPVIGTYKDTWTSQLIVLADNYNVLQENPSFAEDYTANKAKFATTSSAFRSFVKLAEVYQKGYLNKDFLSTNYDMGLKMLAEGTGVHYPMLSGALTALAKNYPDKINDIGIFPQPGDNPDKNGFTVWMPAAFYINKNSKHVEAAKKWLEVYLSPEGIEAYLSKAKPEGPFAVNDVKLPDDVYPAVKEMLPYFEEGKTAPALEFLSPVKGPNLEQITVEVGSGITTPKKGAQLYDKDVEKQAKQLGLKGW